MADEHEIAKEIDEAMKSKRADAEHNGEALDKILKCLDGFSSGMGAMMDRLDALEKRDSYKAKDTEGEPNDKEIKAPGDPVEMTADSRKDSAYDLAQLMAMAQERGLDTGLQHNVRALIDSSLADIQLRADSVYASHGKQIRRPWTGETPSAYRRRLATDLKHYSGKWKNVDLAELTGDALANVCEEIFADAAAAAVDNASYGDTLREVRTRDESGHIVRKYYGSPRSWMEKFSGGRRFAKFNLPGGGRYNG